MERDYWKLREIETRYRLVFDASNEAVMIVSAANLRIVEANRTAVEALNSSRRRNEDLAGRELLHDVAAEDRDAVREMLARIRERGKALSILVHLGADAKPWMLRGSLMTAEPGHVFLLQFTPATGPSAPLEKGEHSTVEQLIDHLPDGFVALDDAGIIRHANQAFLDLVQLGSKGSAIGESLGRWLWQPGADLNALLANIQRHKTVRLFTTSIRGELGHRDRGRDFRRDREGNRARSVCCFATCPVACRPASESDFLRTALGSMSEQIGKSSLRNLVKNTVSIVEQHYVKQALELAGGQPDGDSRTTGIEPAEPLCKAQSLRPRRQGVGHRGNPRGLNWRLHSLATPAFGKADLSNCEREEIHLAGSIQPHGALLVVSEPDHRVVQASANAAEFLNLKQVIGMALADLDGDLLVRILPHLDPTSQGMPIAVRCRIGSPSAEFDGLLHRPPAGGLVIELERAGPSVDLSRQIANALEKIRTASSLRALCDEVATLFQDRTGYDRVMVYRFDDEGHGEVFSERRKPELEAYLGNRYPATDIPQMARRLYERTRVRVLVDVNYEPVPLRPRLSPMTGRDLDMSLCFLRSMSPIHLQYLKNMGVGATLVVSLVVGGKLWGLGRLPPLRTALHPLRIAGGLRTSCRGDRDTHRGAREFCAEPVGNFRAAARTANDRGDVARRRLAGGDLRQLAIDSAAAGGERKRPDLRGPDHLDRRGSGNAGDPGDRGVAGHAAAICPC